MSISPGTMTLPDSSKTPMICVCTGTGIAPIKALLEDRILIQNSTGKKSKKSKKLESYRFVNGIKFKSIFLKRSEFFSHSSLTFRDPFFMEN